MRLRSIAQPLPASPSHCNLSRWKPVRSTASCRSTTWQEYSASNINNQSWLYMIFIFINSSSLNEAQNKIKSFCMLWCGKFYSNFLRMPHPCKGLTCIWSCMRLAGSPFSTGRVLGSSTSLGTTVAADFVNLNVQYYRLTFYWCVIIVCACPQTTTSNEVIVPKTPNNCA